MKGYDWKKGLEKFLVGGGIAAVGSLIALVMQQDPMIVVPIFTAVGSAIWNAVKFFLICPTE